jgi:hypothetical protein
VPVLCLGSIRFEIKFGCGHPVLTDLGGFPSVGTLVIVHSFSYVVTSDMQIVLLI